MRVYEFARSKGVTTKEVLDVVNKGRNQYAQLSAQSSIPGDLQLKFLKSQVKPDLTSTERPELLNKAQVQAIIDKIVDEYGTGWCEDGVSEVNEMLGELGLSITPRYARGSVNLSICFTDMPTTKEFESFLQQKIAEATSKLVFEGREIGYYVPYRRDSHVEVHDLEED